MTSDFQVPMSSTSGGLSLVALVREDFSTHGFELGSPGFQAMAMYRFGAWRGRLAAGPVRWLLRLPYVLLHRRMRRRYRIELHYTSTVGRRVRLSDGGEITIGNGVDIGEDCLIGPGVTLGRTSHGWPTIGDNVQVGPGATLIGAITVGDGAYIGPNSVVLSDIAPGTQVTVREGRTEPAPAGRPRSNRAPDPSLRPLVRSDLPLSASAGSGVLVSSCASVLIEAGVSIGDGCVLREGVSLGWDDGRVPSEKPTVLGKNVELGSGCVVLKGVTVGDGSVIGPKAVISKDVAEGSMITAAASRTFPAVRR